MKTDTVIFDLDGTLLNTLEDLADSTNYAMRAFGLKERSINEVRNFVGNGVDVLIERAVEGAIPKEQELECLDVFKQHYSKNMDNKTKPYDGIMDVIKELLKRGYHIAIVSNKFDAAVKGLNVDYFEGLFPVAIGASDTVAKKPAPDSVIKALQELHSDKERAVYVGDSDVDIMTARNSGLPCISVTWGFRDEELQRSMGTDYIIHKPEELLDVLDGRNRGEC
ncbi:putative phosphoglycolate phosphatase bacterial [Clostridium sp. CAG:590]|nr:putative phosphoglycolate phosphatase bacterial [Clostridium sp. CAG:590]